MSWLEQYQALARYNRLMNRKLYRAAGKLSDEERKRDRGAFFGSIHATFNHLMLADRVWMLRFTGDQERFQLRDAEGQVVPFRSLRQELYADFERLEREREKTDEHIVEYTLALTPEKLATTLSYRTSAGAAQSMPLWWTVSHFFNHQTHHRGQVTTLLFQAGVDPGSTDLVAMLRDEEAFLHA